MPYNPFNLIHYDEYWQWQGKLPRSGQYLVVVGGTRGNATYQLQICIH